MVAAYRNPEGAMAGACRAPGRQVDGTYRRFAGRRLLPEARVGTRLERSSRLPLRRWRFTSARAVVRTT